MNPIEVRYSGLAYSFSLESLKMCLIFCSHLLENQLRYTRTWMSLGCQKLLQSISETRARTETRHMTSNSPPLMHGDQIAHPREGKAVKCPGYALAYIMKSIVEAAILNAGKTLALVGTSK